MRVRAALAQVREAAEEAEFCGDLAEAAQHRRIEARLVRLSDATQVAASPTSPAAASAAGGGAPLGPSAFSAIAPLGRRRPGRRGEAHALCEHCWLASETVVMTRGTHCPQCKLEVRPCSEQTLTAAMQTFFTFMHGL